MKVMLLAIFAVTTIAACTKTDPQQLTHFGTTATITMRDKTTLQGELITMQDSVLFVLADTIRAIPDTMIRSVDLEIPRNRGWIAPVFVFEVLPSVAALGSGNDNIVGIGVLGAIVTGASIWAFIATDPPSSFKWPPTASKIADLRPHFRHPYGLTGEQLESLRSRP